MGESKVTARDRLCFSEAESGAHAGREDAGLAQAQASEGRTPRHSAVTDTAPAPDSQGSRASQRSCGQTATLKIGRKDACIFQEKS